MKKIALFAFNGEMMCFMHVLLNAIDMKANNYEANIIIEGAATKLIPQVAEEDNPMNNLYKKVKEMGLFAGACRACSQKMGVLDAVKAEGLALLDNMNGHPSMARYMDDGFQVITF